MTFWTLDTLESAGIHVEMTAGGLLGLARDGGGINAADTDVDLVVCPADRERAMDVLRQAARPPHLVSSLEYSADNANINVLYAAPPNRVPIDAGPHIEVGPRPTVRQATRCACILTPSLCPIAGLLQHGGPADTACPAASPSLHVL